MSKASVHTLDGKLLQLFLEVYECNSVSRAAERLGLTQSTVSHGLERLRRSLDDPLFVRDGRSIAPTTQADFLAPRVREALSALEALTEPQLYDPFGDTQTLTIAAHPDELQQEFVHIYRALHKHAPNLPLRLLHLGATNNARSMLEAGYADLVIMVRHGEFAPELDREPLFSDRKATFYDRSVRPPVRTMEDFAMAKHAVLDFGGTGPSLLQQQLGQFEINRKVHLYASDLGTLARLMKGTDLVATMQSRFRLSAFSELDYCDPPLALPPIEYDIVWHRRQSLSRRLMWIRQIIQETIAAHK